MSVVKPRSDEYAPEVHAHVKSCRACQQYLERANRVARLLVLKKYEQPDKKAENRIYRNIMDGLESEPHKAQGSSLFFFPRLFPVLGYGIATLFFVLAATHLHHRHNSPEHIPLTWEDKHSKVNTVLSRSSPTPIARKTDHNSVTPVMMPGSSNQGLKTIQYGVQPSMVDFEY